MSLTFTAKLLQGDPTVLRMAKSMIDNPMLITTDPPFAIPVEPVKYSQSSDAEVSERPVIAPGSGVKQYLNDNVAPAPWTWTISGYIPGDPVAEISNYFTPIVMLRTEILKKAYRNGQRIYYKDVNCKMYKNCVIQSLSVDYNAECRNKMPVQLTIKEIVTLETSAAYLTEVENNATPTGSDAEAGTTTTQSVKYDETWIYNKIYGDGTVPLLPF